MTTRKESKLMIIQTILIVLAVILALVIVGSVSIIRDVISLIIAVIAKPEKCRKGDGNK